MKSTAIQDIRCPSCKGRLELNDLEIPIIAYTVDYGEEIKEALLHCSKCATFYPIIAGVAILVSNSLTYVANNYSTIRSLVSDHISAALLNYFDSKNIDLTGDETLPNPLNSNSRCRMHSYIFSHYDDIVAILPKEHPLHQFINDSYGDWYGQLLQLAKPHITSQERSLDLGCSVGGLVYRLASLSQFAYGLDYSFCAVLTARCILLAQPYAQDNYRLLLEGISYQKRPISIKRPTNVEIILASADNIPFEPQSFDLITNINLIDVGPLPRNLLDSIYSALRYEGLLVTSSPYYWDGAPGQKDYWIGGHPNLNSADAMRAELSKHYNILEELDLIPWLLRYNERYYRLFFNHHLVARKE